MLAATTTGTSITASYSASTGVLTLTGSDTLAHYQQVLDSVTYASTSHNPTNSGTDPSRTDLVGGQRRHAQQQRDPDHHGQHHGGDDAPVLGNVAASASYHREAAAATLSSGTTVSDADSQTCLGERCRSAAALLTGDTLAATTTGTSITASYDASTGVLSLTGSDTLAHYQQVLDSVSYASSSQNPTNFGADPSRTVSWVVNDGTLSTRDPDHHGQHRHRGRRCPVLSNVAALPRPTRGAAPTTLSPAATVSDVDNQTLRRRRCRSPAGFSDRRYAGGDDERHQHHRQLQRVDRRAEPDRQRHAGALPAGARQRQLLVEQPKPDQLRRRHEPHDLLGGQRRHAQQRDPDHHGQHHRGHSAGAQQCGGVCLL